MFWEIKSCIQEYDVSSTNVDVRVHVYIPSCLTVRPFCQLIHMYIPSVSRVNISQAQWKILYMCTFMCRFKCSAQLPPCEQYSIKVLNVHCRHQSNITAQTEILLQLSVVFIQFDLISFIIQHIIMTIKHYACSQITLNLEVYVSHQTRKMLTVSQNITQCIMYQMNYYMYVTCSYQCPNQESRHFSTRFPFVSLHLYLYLRTYSLSCSSLALNVRQGDPYKRV